MSILYPQNDLTKKELEALKGTSGSPSSSNKFVTHADSRLSDDRTTSGIRTATTVVAASGSTAPSVGQALIATSSTAASWQNITLPNGTVNPTNLLSNSDFEIWNAGTSILPDNWAQWITTDGTVSRSATFKKNAYSLAMTSTNNYANGILQYICNSSPAITYYQNRTFTFGCWVKCATAAKAKIEIFDGVDATSSSYHTGDNTWQWLTVTRTISGTATQIDACLYMSSGAATAYFDGAMCVEGASAFAFSPKPLTSSSGEIANLYEKTSTANADLLLIEDSAASNIKKKVQLSNLLPVLSGTRVRASQTVAQSIGAASYTKITLTSVQFDTLNEFATSRFTATIAGYYQVNACVTYGAHTAQSQQHCHIYKNGASFIDSYVLSPGYTLTTVEASDLIYLGVGDYLEVYGYSDAATVTMASGSQTSYLSVFRTATTPTENFTSLPSSKVRASQTVSQSTGTATFFKVTLTSVQFDAYGEFNNSRFTCSNAGYYQIDGSVSYNTASGTCVQYCDIYKNGSSYNQIYSYVYSGSSTPTVSDILYLNVGDYVELYGYSGIATTTYAVPPQTSFLAITRLSTSPVETIVNTTTTKVRAYNNSVGQTIGAAWVKLYLPTEQYDTLGEYSPSTYRFTASTAGYYQVNGGCNFGSNAQGTNGHSYLGIKKNGDTWCAIQMIININGYVTALTVSDMVYLNVNDYIELWTYSSVAAAINTVDYFVYMSIFKA